MGQIKETRGGKEKKAVSDKWIREMVGKARVDDKASRGRLASFVSRNLGASTTPSKRMRHVGDSRFVLDVGMRGGEHERKRLVAGTAGLRRLHETTKYEAGSGAGQIMEDRILHREDLAKGSKAQIQSRRPSPPSSDSVPAKKNKDSGKPRALGVVGAAAGLGALTLAARMSRKKGKEKKSSTVMMKQSASWPDEAVRTMELQNFLNAMGSEGLEVSDYTALSLDELEQLVGGVEKVATIMAIGAHPDHHTSWLEQFVGTSLHAQAVRLAEEDLRLESERIRRRLEEPKEQDLWTKQDQLRLQQSMLVLELHKLKNQGEAEKVAISDGLIRKMVHGSKASRERLNQFANRNLIAGGKPGGNRKRLVAGTAATARVIDHDLDKMDDSLRGVRKVVDKMTADRFVREQRERELARKAETRRRAVGGGIAAGAAGATAGLGALALAARMSRKKGKEKKAEIEYSGHVNNGDPKPPKWPASALASISDETKAKAQKALFFGGATLAGMGLTGVSMAAPLSVAGYTALAASGLIGPGKKKKASLADLARQAAAAAKTKRIPISAVKGQTTASGIAAAKQGIAAKASKAIPAPHDVFRSATPKASPFSGAGTATRHAPADPLPPGSMQSIEFLKKYKMASKR